MPLVRVIYLFGSVLNRCDFQDIDLAFLIDNEYPVEKRLLIAAQIGNLVEQSLSYQHECDIHIVNYEPLWFQYEIISTGIPIYVVNEEERLDFETSLLIEYLDMKYNYDLFDREYLALV